MAYADAIDVADLWRPLTVDETARVTALIGHASVIIRGEVPSVDERLAAGTLDEALLRGTVVEMVLRRMQNPDGAKSVTTTTGPWTTSRTYADAVAEGLYLTDSERSRLAPVPAGRLSVGTIRTRRML